MQDPVESKEIRNTFQINNLLLVEKQKLVNAFVWLVEEDKKQNPANYNYQNNKKQND